MNTILAQTNDGTIRAEPAANHCVVTIAGEHDLASADTLERVLAAACDVCPTTIVDLSDTTFIDCRVLGALVEHSRECAQRGGDVTLVVPSGSPVRRVLELTDADEMFTVVAHQPESNAASNGHQAGSRLPGARTVERARQQRLA